MRRAAAAALRRAWLLQQDAIAAVTPLASCARGGRAGCSGVAITAQRRWHGAALARVCGAFARFACRRRAAATRARDATQARENTHNTRAPHSAASRARRALRSAAAQERQEASWRWAACPRPPPPPLLLGPAPAPVLYSKTSVRMDTLGRG